MQTLAGRLGFVGGMLSLAFWVIVPLTVSNTYIHSNQGTIITLFVVLSLIGVAGALLSRVYPGWAAALMAAGVIPAIAALIVPGVLLGVAALLALAPQETGAETPAGGNLSRR
jgi:hypothetical protein